MYKNCEYKILFNIQQKNCWTFQKCLYQNLIIKIDTPKFEFLKILIGYYILVTSYS